MPNQKISQLPAGGAIQPADLIPVARGASNVSILGSDLASSSATSGYSITNYTFDPDNQRIFLLDFDTNKNPIIPELINDIFNISKNQSLYKLGDPLNFAISGNVIIFDDPLTGMEDFDFLKIEYAGVLSPRSETDLIEDGTDLEITCAGANTISFSLVGSSTASLAGSTNGGVTYDFLRCYPLDGSKPDSKLFAGKAYTTPITGVTNLKFVFTGGGGGGFINVAFSLSKDITTIPLAAMSALASGISGKVITNYTFNAAGKEITLNDFNTKNPIDLKLINRIYNATTGETIYELADSPIAGYITVSDNVITIVGSTEGMNDADVLRIEYGQTLDPLVIHEVFPSGADPVIISTNGADTFTFDVRGIPGGNVAVAVSTPEGTDYVNLRGYRFGDSAFTTYFEWGNKYQVSCTGFPTLRIALNSGDGIVVDGALGYGLSNAMSPGAASEETLYDLGIVTQSIDDKTPALGQALADDSVPVVLPAAQMSAIASEDTLLSIDTTTLGIQTLTGSINTATLAIQTSVASLDTKTPSLGVAGAASSRPVTLASETITGQSGLSGTVNNILLPTTAGSAWLDVRAYKSAAVQLISSATAGTAVWECSNDGTNALSFSAVNQGSIPLANASSLSFATGNANATHIFPITTNYIRLRISVALTGGTTQAVTTLSQTPYSSLIPTVNATVTTGQTANGSTATGSPMRVGAKIVTTLPTAYANGQACDASASTAGEILIRKYVSAENCWSYAAAPSGIVSTTTPVQLKAAGAANIRNYVDGIDFIALAGTATELGIRDVGAGTTFLWRGFIPTTGILTPVSITFDPPLRGATATAVELLTVTSSAGAVYPNVRGHQSF